eukprot:3843045-Rhodomonas_salina.1
MKILLTFSVTFGRSFDFRQKFRFFSVEHLTELLPSSTLQRRTFQLQYNWLLVRTPDMERNALASSSRNSHPGTRVFRIVTAFSIKVL